MIMNAAPFEKIWRILHPHGKLQSTVGSFVRYMENKLGARFIYDETQIPYDDISLQPILAIADKLKKAGVIISLDQVTPRADTPRLFGWRARFQEGNEGSASGYSARSSRDALLRTIAESVERHVWFQDERLFKNSIVTDEMSMQKKGRSLQLARLAGLSLLQREHKPHGKDVEQKWRWVRAMSLISNSPIWVPAQLLGASPFIRNSIRNHQEPFLRNAMTTGMATHVTQLEARLAGILEGIERDAYLITWLNQLSCPRVDMRTVPNLSPTLKKLMGDCARYRLKVHFIQMATDAPTHAICVVVEDQCVETARFTLGAKAGPIFTDVAEGALIEALRAHSGTLAVLASGIVTAPTRESVGHKDRLTYWASEKRYKRLEFLVSGPLTKHEVKEWESDTTEQHFQRLLTWCRASNYECISFSFTKSTFNTTPWHIEMTLIPELQPMYFTEKMPHVSGVRLSEIPKKLGYAHREKPFTDEPHPFA